MMRGSTITLSLQSQDCHNLHATHTCLLITTAKHLSQPPTCTHAHRSHESTHHADALKPQGPADAKSKKPSGDTDQCQPVCALGIGRLNQPRSHIAATHHTQGQACQPAPHALPCSRRGITALCRLQLLLLARTGCRRLLQRRGATRGSSSSSYEGMLLVRSPLLGCLSGGLVDHLPPERAEAARAARKPTGSTGPLAAATATIAVARHGP